MLRPHSTTSAEPEKAPISPLHRLAVHRVGEEGGRPRITADGRGYPSLQSSALDPPGTERSWSPAVQHSGSSGGGTLIVADSRRSFFGLDGWRKVQVMLRHKGRSCEHRILC